MHRLATALLVTTLALAGCAGTADLADAARSQVDDARGRLDDLASRADGVRDRFTWCGAAVRLGTAVVERDPDAARAAAEDLRESVPTGLADELETIVTAVGTAQTGDARALLEPDVEAAARTVLDTAVDTCGVEG